MIKIVTLFILMNSFSFGQSFAPLPGEIGSIAMFKDSSSFIAWGTDVLITRGPLNIQNVSLGYADFGIDIDGVGIPDGTAVVSLGDGGEAIITFGLPIINDSGPDFAIFENGFVDNYIELAFVEVSSDGINYFRFPSTSEAPIDVQLTNFSFSDCRYFNNLAGKYRQNYGTPFDLEELVGTAGLDIDNITHVKLIDVVGSIDVNFGTFDTQGNIINDPYPTEFSSCGFDLDAVGVIHQKVVGLDELSTRFNLFPNPTSGIFQFYSATEIEYQIVDAFGNILIESSGVGNLKVSLEFFSKGVYFLQIREKRNYSVQRIVKV